MVWRGVVLFGAVWCGVVWCGVVWCGVVWCGVVWCGVVWCGVVCFIRHRDAHIHAKSLMTWQTWLEVRDGIAESYVFTRVYGFYQYTYNLQLYTPSTERTFVSPFERNQREMIS